MATLYHATSIDDVSISDWQKHGIAEVDGEARTIWRSDTDEDRQVFQITAGDPPENQSGYFRLESLLALKNLKLTDVQLVSAPSEGTTGPRP